MIALAALFFVPLAVAFWLYYGESPLAPEGGTNKGDLIDPARPLLAVADVSRMWALIDVYEADLRDVRPGQGVDPHEGGVGDRLRVGEVVESLDRITFMNGWAAFLDRFNQVEFAPVTTKALRIEVELQPQFSGGVLEWRVQ